MEALDDDGRERSSHHYVPPSPGPSYLGPASVRWRTDMNQKKLPSVGLARADPSSLSASERATTPPAAVPWRISCTKRELRCHLPAWRGCRTPWHPIYPVLHGVLRLSVALLASAAKHERGARQLTVAAIAHQLVVSFREERTYGGLPCPRLDGLRSVLPPPRTCDSKKDLSNSYWMMRCSAAGRWSALTLTARYKSVIGPMRRYAGTLLRLSHQH